MIRPQDLAVDAIGGVEHVVMVVPVDAQKHKAHRVGQKDRQQRTQHNPGSAVGRSELEHHDCHQNRDHTVGERFHPGFCHAH